MQRRRSKAKTIDKPWKIGVTHCCVHTKRNLTNFNLSKIKMSMNNLLMRMSINL